MRSWPLAQSTANLNNQCGLSKTTQGESCYDWALAKGQVGVAPQRDSSFTHLLPQRAVFSCWHIGSLFWWLLHLYLLDCTLTPEVISPLGTKPDQTQPPFKHFFLYLRLLCTESVHFEQKCLYGQRKECCMEWLPPGWLNINETAPLYSTSVNFMFTLKKSLTL